MTQQRPIILGIVGDSAAGKSTLSAGVMRILGPERVTRVCTDDYHKYDRRERAERGITALHPDCNYLDVLQLDLERLYRGLPILKPVYDHATGTHLRPEYIQPRPFVIVDGLLGFSTARLRQVYDVKVYLDPPEELRWAWKVKRDTTKRGYTADEVLRALGQREEDSAQFVRPQRDHADIVVRFTPPPGCRADEAGPDLDARLVLRPTIPHPDLSRLFEPSSQRLQAIRLVLGRDAGRPVDFLEVASRATADEVAWLEATIWRHLPHVQPVGVDQLGDYQDRTEARHSRPLALTQLLLTYHLLRKHDDGIGLAPAAPTETERAAVPLVVTGSTPSSQAW